MQQETWAVQWPGTNVWLLQPVFRSPYQGPQSLSPAANGRETIDLTLYAGIRPWPGAEIGINPEVDQGFGLSDTFGVAGYPSGEAFKVGKVDPYFLVQRGFLRQTVDLGGETEKLDPDLNQLGGTQTANRLVFRVAFRVVPEDALVVLRRDVAAPCASLPTAPLAPGPHTRGKRPRCAFQQGVGPGHPRSAAMIRRDGQVRTRLPAGGKRIRTIGPARRKAVVPKREHH